MDKNTDLAAEAAERIWNPDEYSELHRPFVKKAVDWLSYHLSIKTLHKAIIQSAIEKAYPSGGGEKWTKETVSQLLSDAFSSGDEHGRGLQAISDAHNQSLKPRDCGEETKRLDWVLGMIAASSTQTVVELFGKKAAKQPVFTRNDIDAAMKSQTGKL